MTLSGVVQRERDTELMLFRLEKDWKEKKHLVEHGYLPCKINTEYLWLYL